MPLNGDTRVAIVGGGVCGLTCAVALAKEGIKAEVFEAAVCLVNHTYSTRH